MTEPVKDLWGDLSVEPSPVDILHEQAKALGQRTKNVLEGHLLTDISEEKQEIQVRFAVRAPTLEYQTTLFELRYSMLSPYPCRILESLTDVGAKPSTKWAMPKKPKTRSATDEQELRTAVKDVLRSENVQKIMKGLLSAIGVTNAPNPHGKIQVIE